MCLTRSGRFIINLSSSENPEEWNRGIGLWHSSRPVEPQSFDLNFHIEERVAPFILLQWIPNFSPPDFDSSLWTLNRPTYPTHRFKPPVVIKQLHLRFSYLLNQPNTFLPTVTLSLIKKIETCILKRPILVLRKWWIIAVVISYLQPYNTRVLNSHSRPYPPGWQACSVNMETGSPFPLTPPCWDVNGQNNCLACYRPTMVSVSVKQPWKENKTMWTNSFYKEWDGLLFRGTGI